MSMSTFYKGSDQPKTKWTARSSVVDVRTLRAVRKTRCLGCQFRDKTSSSNVGHNSGCSWKKLG